MVSGDQAELSPAMDYLKAAVVGGAMGAGAGAASQREFQLATK
jgi:hypothetical protein